VAGTGRANTWPPPPAYEGVVARLRVDQRNGTGGPITGVFTGAAAPIRMMTALPPGFWKASTSIFQLFVTYKLPDGSTAPAVIRSSASL
jgi:hypothetical protein